MKKITQYVVSHTFCTRIFDSIRAQIQVGNTIRGLSSMVSRNPLHLRKVLCTSIPIDYGKDLTL